ncbi:MAG: hypothetical protein R3C14_18010 [Caldilineaceae bacterium]
MFRNLRGKLFAIVTFIILISALYTGAVNAGEPASLLQRKNQLENVRDYAPALSADALNYAIDGGLLFAGQPTAWQQLPTPANVIVGAVAQDPENAQTLYIGAANEMAIYRSQDAGAHWLRIPLSNDYIGGITDIAINPAQRTLYVGSDTAGIFRLRDIGSSMILSGHTMFDEAVLEIVADQKGAGLAFARTEWHVFRGISNGMEWMPLDMLTSAPTALAIVDTAPATIYIGTTDRGLLKSTDGFTWQMVNAGFAITPGTRLQVDALAADPVQPAVLYVAMSYLSGHYEVHQAPVGVLMSTDTAIHWTSLPTTVPAPIVRLLPVSGQSGAAYALTTQSRTPLAIGSAPIVNTVDVSTVSASTNVSDTQWRTSLIAWVVAALASATLVWMLLSELLMRSRALVSILPLKAVHEV